MVTKHMSDDINNLVRVYSKCVEELKVDTFLEYYKSVYGEDEWYQDKQLLDMYALITDPYTLWEAEPETLKSEIEKVLVLIEQDNDPKGKLDMYMELGDFVDNLNKEEQTNE